MTEVATEKVLAKVSTKLKEEKLVDPPIWAAYVKTGVHKERPPVDEHWWYIRAASVLRKVDNNGPIGVNKLRRAYGGRKNRGYRPEHFYRGSGNITRKILQQLETSGLVKQDKAGNHKGRVITPKGQKLLASR